MRSQMWAVLIILAMVSAGSCATFQEQSKLDIGGCAGSIAGLAGCALDLLKSVTSFKLHLSPECCNAVGKFGDKCLSPFVPGFPEALFRPLLQGICSAFNDNKTD